MDSKYPEDKAMVANQAGSPAINNDMHQGAKRKADDSDNNEPAAKRARNNSQDSAEQAAAQEADRAADRLFGLFAADPLLPPSAQQASTSPVPACILTMLTICLVQNTLGCCTPSSLYNLAGSLGRCWMRSA